MSLFELCWFYDAYGIITEGVQWAFGNTIMELTRSNGVGHTDSTAVNVNVVVVAWKCMVLFRHDTQGVMTESDVEATRDLSVLSSFLPVVFYIMYNL